MPQVLTTKKPVHAAPPSMEKPKPKVYTSDELMEIAASDPKRAQELLDFQNSLERQFQKEASERATLRMKLNNLKEVEAKLEAEARFQQACSRQGHVRPDGESRLQGQYVGQGRDRVLQLTCNQCYKQYTGVGSEEGQLPMELANRLDLTVFGG